VQNNLREPDWIIGAGKFGRVEIGEGNQQRCLIVSGDHNKRNRGLGWWWGGGRHERKEEKLREKKKKDVNHGCGSDTILNLETLIYALCCLTKYWFKALAFIEKKLQRTRRLQCNKRRE
jgi:hypothetical protein